MPALSVHVDSVLQACVRTDGLYVLSVSIHGAKIDPELATVEFAGTTSPEAAGQSTYLTWLNELTLHPGQVVRVTLGSDGATSHAGKTIEQLFPDELHEEKHGPMPSRQHLVNEVRSRERVRERIRGVVRSSSGAENTFATTSEDHAVSASFVWNWLHPERVSASLYTYTLDQLAAEDGFTDLFAEQMALGSWVEVEVDA